MNLLSFLHVTAIDAKAVSQLMLVLLGKRCRQQYIAVTFEEWRREWNDDDDESYDSEEL